MALFNVKDVAIKGVCSCVPKVIEENINYPFGDGENTNKFILTTGIERRRIVNDQTTSADLCYKAAERLIADLEWEKSSIDYLIFVTQSPDYILPATSCVLQQKLGLATEVCALDISSGCSGWIYGMSVLSQMLSSSGLKRGLLLCGDTISKFASSRDKSTYPLFGDAGTATALERDIDAPLLTFHLATDGSGADAIWIPEGGFRKPFSEASLFIKEVEQGISRNNIQLILNGMDVFAFGISKAPQSVNKLLEFVSLEKESVDYYLFHQANLFMNEKIRKKLKLKEEQVPYSLKDYGNTSSATIPLTMTTQLNNEVKNKKLRMIACGFGVGLSWGSCYFETENIVCPQIIEV